MKKGDSRGFDDLVSGLPGARAYRPAARHIPLNQSSSNPNPTVCRSSGLADWAPGTTPHEHDIGNIVWSERSRRVSWLRPGDAW